MAFKKKLKNLFSRKHRQPDPEPDNGHLLLEEGARDAEPQWSHRGVSLKEMPPGSFGGARKHSINDEPKQNLDSSQRSLPLCGNARQYPHSPKHISAQRQQLRARSAFQDSLCRDDSRHSNHSHRSTPDEMLMAVVSTLMHRQDCQIPNCSCKLMQERYRELHRQHPSYDLHQHAAEICKECGPNADPGERKHMLHLALSNQNLTSDTHPHYHLTTKSHIRHAIPRPTLKRQRSRPCDLTPSRESPPEFPPFAAAPADGPEVDGFNSDPEVYKPPFLREISMSADNIPALCIDDGPLTPTPLTEFPTLIHPLPDIQQLFQEAMKRGHVMCRTLNYAVTGAAGTGKTHTVSLILNEDPPEERHSTGLLNSPIRAISSSLAIGSNPNSETPTLRRAKEGELLDIMAISAKQGIENQDSSVPDEQQVHISEAPDEHQASTPVVDGKDYRNLQAAQELFAKLASGMKEVDVSSKQLGAFDLVHLLDSGGQPQFHQLLPTFVPHLDANIFVLKLCEMLDQHPTVELYHKGKLVTSYRSFHTNQQILKHCIRAIQSQSSPDGDSTTRIAVVGTHKDQQHKCSETLNDKNKELIALLKSKFGSDNLIYYQSLQEMIFPVNAKTPTEEDREVAWQLVKSITDNSTSKAKPIPLPWFMLERLLRKQAEDKGTGVLHINECQDIANKLGIRREALGAALGYLVGLNLFLYYPQVLPKVFFSEPQVFLDKINELVQCSHLLRGDPNLLPDELKIKLRGLCGKQWERFGYYGILTEELLKHEVFASYYVYDNELFTPANLLELLQALLIISPINRTEFIMPCLLPELGAEELDKHRSDLASSIAPLLIHFPNEWPQSGVFCSLTASLLSSSQWEVLQGGNNEPTCLYQNCIDFQLPGPGVPGTVTLIDSFDSGYFEVHVDDNCKPLCPQIRQTIFTTLERHIPNAPKPVIAFFCPQKGKRCKAFCHRACYICSCQYWKCSENPRVNGKLTEHQGVWIKSGNTSTDVETQGDQPTLRELLKFQSKDGIKNIPEEIATKYVEFSIFLLNDRNGSRARIMACKHHCDAQRINIEILQEWLIGRGKLPVTWATLVEVLRDIELSTLAGDIATTKCQQDEK